MLGSSIRVVQYLNVYHFFFFMLACILDFFFPKSASKCIVCEYIFPNLVIYPGRAALAFPADETHLTVLAAENNSSLFVLVSSPIYFGFLPFIEFHRTVSRGSNLSSLGQADIKARPVYLILCGLSFLTPFALS